MTPGAPITGILWHQSYRLPKGNTISVFTFTLGCFQFELVYITGWIDMNLLIATRLLHAHVITIVVHVYKVFLDLWLAENETSLNQLSLKYLCCAKYFSILKIPREWNVFSNYMFFLQIILWKQSCHSLSEGKLFATRFYLRRQSAIRI